MSLLRDGIHRRAPLTSRSGSARSGAARSGWCPGQDDFRGLTREIKNSALVSEGPFYVWKERYPTQSPFSGLVQYPEQIGIARLLLGGNSDSSKVTSANLLLGGDSTASLKRATATPARLLLGGYSFTLSSGPLALAGDSDASLVPGP